MAEKLNTVENIQIPYPEEGVIRTAQIDDTIAPKNSVQLAVNMNFDRIGATQTRPGVTEYADDLTGPIRNYGTLNNNRIQAGYTNITKNALTNDFSDTAGNIAVGQVDETHYVVFYQGTSNDGYAVLVEVDLDTGEVTQMDTPIEYDATNGTSPKTIQVDSTHFLTVWQGSGDDGYAQIFSVNTTTGVVTALGTPLEFDATGGFNFSLAQIDSTHFTCFYIDNSLLGIVSNLAVDTGTWAVTEVGSPLTLEATNGAYPNVVALGNGTHFLAAWSGSGLAKAQVYSVNTGTWNSTAIGSTTTYDANQGTYVTLISMGGSQYFVSAWSGQNSDGFTQALSVNQSTYAVSAVGSPLEFDTSNAAFISTVSMEDGEHFTIFHRSSDSDGKVQVFNMDQTTYAITASSNLVTFADIDVENTGVLVNSQTLMNFWGDDASTPGSRVVSLFDVYGDRLQASYLYAQDGDWDVYNWDGANWTLRRSGLREVSKARFDQWLDVIWMVNGATGDSVATSDGGNFGTEYVPAEFPAGDFISAGFEGRVWVADADVAAVYYTDIVQFTPPDTFSLTYNAEVNFINFSPQDGQRITALCEVPRALLVFKENCIYRIYGATSVDAYPSYNVGTYSQESIITTKTGIFFHHSSGFYQFDYGSQPIEISRRVIDFVKAIPRSNYENIVGVYDGFDAVEWAIGEVTVEGVTFTNCVMRFTISTQVWTVYDYVGNEITAMISYDDSEELNHLMGTEGGKTGALDVGLTDFGEPFYYEFIDRWRAFTDMWCYIKSIDGINVYSENAGGAKLSYQIQKSGANVWEPLMTVNENNNSLVPGATTDDFDVLRLRLAGTTKGEPIVIHGIEILSLTIKGLNQN